MNIRIKLLAAAALTLPVALAAQPSNHAPLQDRPAARTRTPPAAPTPPPAAEAPPASQAAPAAATPPVSDNADEATQQAADSTAPAAQQAHETAERAADAVEADAVSDAQIHAQAQTMPPPAAPDPAATPAEAPAAAQAQATAPVGPAVQADFRAGANVVDQAGGTVGTIESVDASGAVVATGTVRAKLPLASFGRSTQGLVIAMTKGQLEAAVAAQSPAPTPGG
jgi:chemotaxis protein histidine kinase CheA